MELRVLGSAQDAGVPQLFCACPRCSAARADPARRRTASAAAVVDGDGYWLLDASPDLRHQAMALDAEGLSCRGVLLTHAHAGHVAGLLALGKEGPWRRLTVWATPRLAKLLRSNEPFAGLFARLELRELAPGVAVATEEGVTFTAHPLVHRAELADTVALEAERGGRRALYMPDTDRLDEAAMAALARLRAGDVALVDATFWSADELPGRDIAEVPHPTASETVERLAPLVARGVRVVLGHLNHTNPLVEPASPERRRAEAAGFVVAEDGLRLARSD